LFHLSSAGFIPGCRIIAVALDDLHIDDFRRTAREALDEFSSRKVAQPEWDTFAANLDYLPLTAGAEALKAAVLNAELSFNGECRRLHYLSVPPNPSFDFSDSRNPHQRWVSAILGGYHVAM